MARQNTGNTELPSHSESAEIGSEEATGTTSERETGSEKIYRCSFPAKRPRFESPRTALRSRKIPTKSYSGRREPLIRHPWNRSWVGKRPHIRFIKLRDAGWMRKRRKPSRRLRRTRRSPHIVTASGISCARRRRAKDNTRAGQSAANVAEGRAFLAEAEVWLAQAKSGKREKATSTGTGLASDPQSRRILAKLEVPLTMNFANETAT